MPAFMLAFLVLLLFYGEGTVYAGRSYVRSFVRPYGEGTVYAGRSYVRSFVRPYGNEMYDYVVETNGWS